MLSHSPWVKGRIAYRYFTGAGYNCTITRRAGESAASALIRLLELSIREACSRDDRCNYVVNVQIDLDIETNRYTLTGSPCYLTKLGETPLPDPPFKPEEQDKPAKDDPDEPVTFPWWLAL